MERMNLQATSPMRNQETQIRDTLQQTGQLLQVHEGSCLDLQIYWDLSARKGLDQVD